MNSIYEQHPAPTPPRLALKPDEAAASLGISPKSLYNRSQPRGPIPCLRIGTRVLYPTHLLRKWMNREAIRQQREAEQAESQQEESADGEGGN